MQGLANFHPYYRDLLLAYSKLEMVGVEVSGRPINGVITGNDDAIHLDSVLAWAVTEKYGAPIDDAIIPLPLKCVWVSDTGLPLWCSTPFDMGTPTLNFKYWHKRSPELELIQWCQKPNVSTSSGRHKEYRVPIGVKVVDRITARCIGNRNEIEQLLDYIAGVGKKVSIGYGSVVKWEVNEVSISEEEILKNRPIPVEFFKTLPLTCQIRCKGAWTSPYWNKTYHQKIVLNWE